MSRELTRRTSANRAVRSNGVPRRVLKSPEEIKGELDAVLADREEGETPEQEAARRTWQRVVARHAGVDERGAVRPAQIAYFGPETLDELKAAVSFRWIRP